MPMQHSVMVRRTLFLALFVAVSGLFASAAHAGDDADDSARARTALEHGQIRPLAGILTAVEQRYEGRVIETELEYRHDCWVYEFKLLPPTGRIFTLRIDANSGQMLETHGPVQERH